MIFEIEAFFLINGEFVGVDICDDKVEFDAVQLFLSEVTNVKVFFILKNLKQNFFKIVDCNDKSVAFVWCRIDLARKLKEYHGLKGEIGLFDKDIPKLLKLVD